MDWSKVLDGIEKAINVLFRFKDYVFFICLVLYILTFLPRNILDWPSFVALRPVFMVVTIGCLVIILIQRLKSKGSQYISGRNDKERLRNRIKELAPSEKEILRRIYKTGRQEFKYDTFGAPLLTNMIELDIVRESSSWGSITLSYVIHPRAWELIEKESMLLGDG